MMLTRASAKVPGQHDLFTEEVSLVLPARLAVEGKILGSATRQQAVPPAQTLCRLRPFTVRRVGGFETTLKSGETLKILSAKTATMLDADLVLLVPDPISLQILGADTPGARLSDRYEFCGQAQKSARWRDRPHRMLQHMLKREQMRRDRGARSVSVVWRPQVMRRPRVLRGSVVVFRP